MTGRVVPVAACAAALGYAVAKVLLAVRAEPGLPGFPAPSRPGVDVVAAQFGNAGLGVLGALLALTALRRWGRLPKYLLLAGLAVAAVSETVGAAALVARVLRLVDGFGALPPGPGPALGAAYAALTAALFVATAVIAARAPLSNPP